MGGKRLTTELFIERSKSIHGDRYDYSKTIFIKSKTRVIITCSKHGDFYQIPHEHLKGSNCKRCSATNWTEDRFIYESNKKHNGFYSYENSGFTIRNENVFVTCPKHGRFETSAHSHLKGHGCYECGKRTWTGQSRSSYINFCKNKYNGKSFLYLIKVPSDSDLVYKVGISSLGVNARYSNEKKAVEEILREIHLPAALAWDIEKLIMDEFSEYRSNNAYLRSGNTECFVNPDIDKICYSIDKYASKVI